MLARVLLAKKYEDELKRIGIPCHKILSGFIDTNESFRGVHDSIRDVSLNRIPNNVIC